MTRFTLVAATLLGAIALAGCEKRNTLAKMPPPSVTVATPVEQEVVDYAEFTGVTRSAARVELRARVKGMLLEINFEDGAIVKKGDLLFRIDPKPYANAQKAARAALEKAKASLALAEQQLVRTKELLSRNATSQEALDSQNAQQAMAAAEVASAEASLKTADLNFGYTEVRAPLSGRISENRVDVGNLVQAETTILAQIEAIDPIQAYFTVSERDITRLAEANIEAAAAESPKSTPAGEPGKKESAEVDPPMPAAARDAAMAAAENENETDQIKERGSAAKPSDGLHVPQTEVLMALGDSGKFDFKGYLDYEEFGVEEGTGTVMRRALFNNADRRLIPGLFVRLRMALGPPAPKLLVEDRAVVADQRGEYVLVVGKDDVVENRPVRLGSLHGTLRVVEEGLKPSDRVVVIGVQRARPGMPVTPKLAGQPDPAAAPAKEAVTAQKAEGQATEKTGEGKGA